MSDEEADLLEEDPLFREIIQMRRWDEAAKLENQPIPSLDIFKELISSICKNNLISDI